VCVRIYFVCGVVLYEYLCGVCVFVWLSRGQTVFWLAGLASITDAIEICGNRGQTLSTHVKEAIPLKKDHVSKEKQKRRNASDRFTTSQINIEAFAHFHSQLPTSGTSIVIELCINRMSSE
jgi:hypothetical protein